MEHRNQRQVEAPRGVNDQILAGGGDAARLHNLVVTPYGTLRTVVGPCEYTQTRTDINSPEPAGGRYQAMLGLHHAVVEGGRRSLLLAHFDGAVWEHRGWVKTTAAGTASAGWRQVAATVSTGTPTLVTAARAEDARSSDFLTQFVSTPDGVVIVPQDGRALFYDGEVCLPLGYDRAPGPPSGLAPVQARVTVDALVYADTQAGYLKTGRTMDSLYGNCRLGTVRGSAMEVTAAGSKGNPLGGVLESGAWRAAVQWVDYFGNLSPIGGLSSPVQCRKEDNLTKDRRRQGDESVERLRIQTAWTQLSPGPEGTVGRILLRTHDLLNSGITGMWEVPPDATTTSVAFATIPDNEAEFFPDNVPDAWLVVAALDVVAVPKFRVATQAFGRLWIANWPGANGAVRYSEAGRWGTFARDSYLVPDPRGWDVTGFLLTPAGLLIFTETSTHLVAPNDQGEGFRAITLSTTAGCVSPNSAAQIPGGPPLWLGREGWYALDGNGQVQLVSGAIQEHVVQRISRSYWRHATATTCPHSREYRCWVPLDGERKALCVVFDGTSWRTRDDVDARDVCTTADHRGYVLALGYADVEGLARFPSVWVQDHEGYGPRRAPPRTAVIETTWLRAGESELDVQHLSTLLWVRETSKNVAPRIDFFRDWRTHPAVHTVTDNPRDLLVPETEDLLWGEALVGGTYRPASRQRPDSRANIPTHWTRRQPFWVRVDTHNPGKVFKARITVEGDFDFAAYRTDEARTGSPGLRPSSVRSF